jgi:2-amino-4-hydroxy-6-hydroxymethyldihydropteridine diphosphokinase
LFKNDQVIVLALGSNQWLGDQGPGDLLRLALGELSADGVQVLRVSRFFETLCFPPGAGPDYVNAVAVVSTDLAPQDLLAALHRIEASLGRQRSARWGARTVDIDLIAYGQRVLPDVAVFRDWLGLPLEQQQTRAPDQLILPHPRMQDRAFVLVPMQEVAPDWTHPVLKRTVRQLCESLPKNERDEVKVI